MKGPRRKAVDTANALIKDKKGFLVLGISGTPLRARKGPGLSSMGGGSPSFPKALAISRLRNTSNHEGSPSKVSL